MKRTQGLIVMLLVVSFVFTPGCGLLVNGQKQAITIDTDPSNAKINIVGAGIQGVSPISVRLKRNNDYQVMAEKDGRTGRAYINSEIEPLAVILDIVFWGGLALLVDWPLGAAHQLSPENVFIPLQKD